MSSVSPSQDELSAAVEFIKDKLYWLNCKDHPYSTATALYFSIDDELIYEPFLADFGPLHLGHLYRFCCILDGVLKDPAHANKVVYYYCSHDPLKRANSAYLISAYAMLYLGRSPEEAYRPFLGIYPSFPPFRDAAFGVCLYQLTVLDCLRGLYKASQKGFFDFNTFDVEEYEFYERAENGDMNWIVPKKFLAFSGPAAAHTVDMDGLRTHTPEDYIPYFRKHSMGAVIRLNKKMYDKKRFTDAGIHHFDMYYIDGGLPTDAIIKRFMEVCESEKGAIAVHCKAGLGRTGSLVGLYLMKHYHFTAAEAIAWLRISRPGSVIGPQQHFLQDMQVKMWKQGELFRKRQQAKDDMGHVTNGVSSMNLGSSGRTKRSTTASSRDTSSRTTSSRYGSRTTTSTASPSARSTRTTSRTTTSTRRTEPRQGPVTRSMTAAQRK